MIVLIEQDKQRKPLDAHRFEPPRFVGFEHACAKCGALYVDPQHAIDCENGISRFLDSFCPDGKQDIVRERCGSAARLPSWIAYPPDPFLIEPESEFYLDAFSAEPREDLPLSIAAEDTLRLAERKQTPVCRVAGKPIIFDQVTPRHTRLEALQLVLSQERLLAESPTKFILFQKSEYNDPSGQAPTIHSPGVRLFLRTSGFGLLRSIPLKRVIPYPHILAHEFGHSHTVWSGYGNKTQEPMLQAFLMTVFQAAKTNDFLSALVQHTTWRFLVRSAGRKDSGGWVEWLQYLGGELAADIWAVKHLMPSIWKTIPDNVRSGLEDAITANSSYRDRCDRITTRQSNRYWTQQLSTDVITLVSDPIRQPFCFVTLALLPDSHSINTTESRIPRHMALIELLREHRDEAMEMFSLSIWEEAYAHDMPIGFYVNGLNQIVDFKHAERRLEQAARHE